VRQQSIQADLPSELVDQLVVEVAHEHEIVEIGATTVLPVPCVVGLQEGAGSTSGESAPVVSEAQLAHQPLRYVARCSSYAEGIAVFGR
jgi:hypothetical protein